MQSNKKDHLENPTQTLSIQPRMPVGPPLSMLTKADTSLQQTQSPSTDAQTINWLELEAPAGVEEPWLAAGCCREDTCSPPSLFAGEAVRADPGIALKLNSRDRWQSLAWMVGVKLARRQNQYVQ